MFAGLVAAVGVQALNAALGKSGRD
jgi:hypothetical protein